jgi:hypothetical protein
MTFWMQSVEAIWLLLSAAANFVDLLDEKKAELDIGDHADFSSRSLLDFFILFRILAP